MRKIRLLCAIMVLLLCSSAYAADVKEVRERIAKKAGGVTSISAAFVQEKHLAMFKEVLKSKGRFMFQKPGSLRWELTEPTKTGFVINGEKGRRWHELTGQDESFSIERDPVIKAVSDQLWTWARADFAKLDAMYDVKLKGDNPAVFRLSPKGADAGRYLKAIEIAFSSDEIYVREVTVFEDGGDRTVMTFGPVKVNEPIPAGTF